MSRCRSKSKSHDEATSRGSSRQPCESFTWESASSPGSQHHVNESLQTIAVFTFQTPFLTPTSHPTESCPNRSFVSKVNVAAVLGSKFWRNLLLSQGNRNEMRVYWSHYRKKKKTSQLSHVCFSVIRCFK